VFQVEPTSTDEEVEPTSTDEEALVGLVVGLVVGVIVSGLFGFVLRGYVKTSRGTGKDEVNSHTSSGNEHTSSSVLAVPMSPDRSSTEPSYERSALKMLPEYKDQVRGRRPPGVRAPAQQPATAPCLPAFKDQVLMDEETLLRPIRVDEGTDQHERSNNSMREDESSEKSFSGTMYEI